MASMFCKELEANPFAACQTRNHATNQFMIHEKSYLSGVEASQTECFSAKSTIGLEVVFRDKLWLNGLSALRRPSKPGMYSKEPESRSSGSSFRAIG